MALWRAAVLSLGLFQLSYAAVTIYHAPGQQAFGTQTDAAAAAATYTGAAAYNPTRLNPPPVPSPLPSMNFPIQLQKTGTAGLSITQYPGFFGFSVEMSVVNQVLGKNSSLIQVPFLNLMATLRERSGRVNVRMGGNSQEHAVMVESLDHGRVLEKDNGSGTQNPTHTPALLYTKDLLYMLRNISDLAGVYWFIGVPFADPNNFNLDIVLHGQEILGDYLIALQVGNEPDLYQDRLRTAPYGPGDFFREWGNFIKTIQANPNVKNTTMLMGPSISNNGNFREQEMWDTGFVDAYSANIAYLSTEHYPDNNCAAIFNNGGTVVDPQQEFPKYLTHDAGKNLISGFVGSTAFAQSKGKRYLMMETNTASCGGFAGISDSFGAAIWGVDYAMTLVYNNFSGANFHVGGQQAFYNPFTPPPTNQSSFHSWTVGPIYYSAVVVAEALGSQVSQVLDLNANSGSVYTPAYAIYENGSPVRVLLINYITDPSGASTYTAQISIDGSAPPSVKTKSLAGYSVSDKYNYTWAGQTMGNIFEASGKFKGEEKIDTVPCSGNTCNIQVPAPGVVLVFLTDAAIETGVPATTYTTSVFTKLQNTATVDKSVLATSNGHSGQDRELNFLSTSRGSANSAESVRHVWSLWAILSVTFLTAILRSRFTLTTN